jgi:hypothetical protein
MVTFLNQDQVNYPVEVFQIVTPSAHSRVRLYVRAVKPLASPVAYTVAATQDAVGQDGEISDVWHQVAMSSGDVARFSFTLSLKLPAADSTSIPIEWRYEIVGDSGLF